MVGEVLRRFRRDRFAVAGTVLLGGFGLLAFLGPLLWRYDHTIHREISADAGPSLAHPFGTSRTGHDLLGQVIRGTRQSLVVGALAGTVSAVLGTAWGAAAGTRQGVAGPLLMRLVDVALVVPAPIVVLVLVGTGGRTTSVEIGLAIGALSWPVTARVTYGLATSLRSRPFVDAARALGASDARVVARHVVPHLLGPSVVAGSFAVSAAILIEASLSFVGFGIAPPDTSLGVLVETAQAAAFTRPWLFLIPGAFLVVLCAVVPVVGDGLADALGGPEVP